MITMVGSVQREKGMTLIELLVAMVISGLLMGFVFTLFAQMSVAYKGQGKKSELAQSLMAAKHMIMKDVINAGNRVTVGFKTNVGGNALDVQPPIQVVNDFYNGTDLLKIFYADTRQQAMITREGTSPATYGPNQNTIRFVNVDDGEDFAAGDVVVISRYYPDGNKDHIVYDACVLAVSSVSGDGKRIYFRTSINGTAGANYNTSTNVNCQEVFQKIESDTIDQSVGMVYKFVGRAYRIGPAGTSGAMALLYSDTGDLEGTGAGYQVAGVGFSDLQIAMRYFENSDVYDPDGDGDGERDWYSGEQLEYAKNCGGTGQPVVTNTCRHYAGIPTHLSLSLVVRSLNEVRGVPTKFTPTLTVQNKNNFNRFGDRDKIDVSQEKRRYRHFSTMLDIRSMGVNSKGTYTDIDSQQDVSNWEVENFAPVN